MVRLQTLLREQRRREVLLRRWRQLQSLSSHCRELLMAFSALHIRRFLIDIEWVVGGGQLVLAGQRLPDLSQQFRLI